MRIKTCDVCGIGYCPDLAEDRWTHYRVHSKAIYARDVLTGTGPCPLPTSYREREQLKQPAYEVADASRANDLVTWSHFARSLEAMDYDLSRHPSWRMYREHYCLRQASQRAQAHYSRHDSSYAKPVSREGNWVGWEGR